MHLGGPRPMHFASAAIVASRTWARRQKVPGNRACLEKDMRQWVGSTDPIPTPMYNITLTNQT